MLDKKPIPIMKEVRRFIFIAGLGFAILSSIGAFFANKPPWFSEAVYFSSVFIGLSLIVLWGFTELMSHSFPGKLMGVFLLSIALTAAIVPNLQINIAVFLGQPKADVNTWHLLPLFAVISHISAVLFIGILFGAICMTITIVTIGRKSPNKTN